MNLETVKEYIPNYEIEFKQLKEDYAQQVGTDSGESNLTDRDIKSKFIIPLLNRLIDDKEFTSTPQRVKEYAKMNKEILIYLRGEVKSGELKPIAETRTANQAVMISISKVLKEQKYLKYNGKPLSFSDLKEDFDPYLVSVPQPRKDRKLTNKVRYRINVSSLKKQLTTALGDYDFPKIKTNINKLTAQITKINNEAGERPSSLGFKIENVSMLKVFNTQKLADFEKRKKTYDYWEKVHEELNTLVTEVGELRELLKDVDEDVDVTKFLKVTNEGIEKINYVQDFDSKLIPLSKLNLRAMEFLELFWKQQGYLAEPTKISDLAAETYSYEVEGKDDQKAPGMSVGEDIHEDSVIPDEEINIGDKYDMDALGVLHFKRNLNNLGVISSEDLSTLTGHLEDFFEEIKKGDTEDTEILIDSKAEEAFGVFLKSIKSLDDYSEGNTYLPVFFANEPELESLYKTVKSESYSKKINDFLLAFKNLIEGDVKSQAPTMLNTGSLTGAGVGPVIDPNKTGYSGLFAFKEYLSGRSSSPKKQMKTTEKKNKEIFEKFRIISKLILDYFAEQKFSPNLMGIDLPFSNSVSLRSISTYDVPEDSKSMFQILNKVFIEDGEAFLEKSDIVKINEFLDTLSKGDSIAQYDEIEKKASVFFETISELYENDTATKKARLEIASILGSIYRFKSEEKGKKWEGLDIMDALNKVFVDEIEEITTLQVLADIIRSNPSMFEEDDTDAAKLLANLDRVSKSDINKKLLEAHDTLRILKSKPVMYSMKNENNFDDMDDMLTKMEKEYQIDMSANEIINVINKVDSFEGIAKEYGISSEHVYVIKANFR